MPALTINGGVVKPIGTITYYVARDKNPATIEAPPKGLEMIAGDAHAVAPQRTEVTGWYCVLSAAPSVPVPAARPDCPPLSQLLLSITFPDCWDGRRLDSRNDQRHIAYSVPMPGRIYLRCPASTPFRSPRST